MLGKEFEQKIEFDCRTKNKNKNKFQITFLEENELKGELEQPFWNLSSVFQHARADVSKNVSMGRPGLRENKR